MNNNFPQALGFVLKHECVFSRGHEGDLNFVVAENVPGDTGGCTKFGIDQASHPGVDIEALTLEAAAEIYRQGEWSHCRCDELPPRIDAAVFDCAVNNGPGASGILLQRALQRHGFMLVTDGEIGLKTIAATVAEARTYPDDLLKALLNLRREHYAEIVLHRPADHKFLRGWLSRVDDLEQFLTAAGEGRAAAI